MSERLIIEASIRGVEGAKSELRSLSNEITRLNESKTRLNRNESDYTTKLNVIQQQLTQLTREYNQLSTEITRNEQAISRSVNATTNLSNAQQRAAQTAQALATQTSTAFSVVGSTLNLMGTTVDSTFTRFANTRFPQWGELSRGELSVLQQSYQQAEQIGTNSFDMQTLAMNVFRGNIEQVNLAVTAYQQLLQNNTGVDAITLNTAAFVGLRNQVEGSGYSVRTLNSQISNIAIASNNVYEKFKLMNVSVKEFMETNRQTGDISLDVNKLARSWAVAKDQLQAYNDVMLSMSNGTPTFDITGAMTDTGNTGSMRALENYKSSINGLREQVSALVQQYESLSISERDSLGPDIIRRIQSNTEELNRATAATDRLGIVSARTSRSGFNPLANSVQQLAREMPNFAISAQIGFMAISNNLPIMADAIASFRATQAAAAAAGQPTQSLLRGIASSVMNLGGVFTLLSGVLLIFGPQLWNMTKALFSANDGVKKLTYSEMQLLTTQQTLNKTMKDGGGVYSDAIKSVELLTVQLDKSRGSKKLEKQATDDYNKSLGLVFGQVKNVDQALQLISKNKDRYIEAMKNMSFANAFFAESAKDAVKIMEVSTKSQQQLLTDAGKDAKGMFEKWQAQTKEIEETKTRIKTMEASGQDTFFTKNLLKTLMTNHNLLATEMTKIEQTEKARQIKLIENNQKQSLKSAEKYYDDYAKIAQKAGFGSGKSETRVSTGARETVQAEKLPTKSPFSIYKEQFITEYTLYLGNQRALTNKEEVDAKYALKTKQDGWRQTLQDQRNYLYATQIAELNDAKRKRTSMEVDIQTATDKINRINNDAKEELRILNESNKAKVEASNKYKLEIERLEEDVVKKNNEWVELKKKDTKKMSESDKKIHIQKIRDKEKEIVSEKEDIENLKKKRSDNQKDLDAATAKRDKIQADLDNAGNKSKEEIEKLKNELIGVNSEITKYQNIVNQQPKNKFLEGLKDAVEVGEKLKGVMEGLSSISNERMEVANTAYEDQIYLYDQDLAANKITEDQKTDLVYKAEVKRYEAQKQAFEDKKAFDTGVSIITALNAEMGAVGNFIQNGGFLSPVAIVSLAAETAMIGITLANTVSEIGRRRLRAPIKPSLGGNSASGSGGANIALNPTKTALTSKEENLNMMNQSGKKDDRLSVKVTDINNVQTKVAVRETNSAY